jgi:uncharacterized protein YutE (UPF0331/DUF86 family)
VTDPDLIAKKLALIETSVRELQMLARPEEMWRDIREERFVEHTLQIAIQAALDIASHIVSDERLGEPRTNRELSTCWPAAGGSRRVCLPPCAAWWVSGTSWSTGTTPWT